MLSRCFFSLSLFLLLFPSFLLIPQPASAAAFGLVPCALQNDNPATNWDDRAPCTLCHFLIGMNFVVKFLRNLMTAIAIAIMVAMAIMYIVSAGNEDMMATAKKGIIGSLIGIVVILLAWVIVNFIFTLPIFANNGLVKTDGSWDTFTCNTTSQSGWAGTRNTSGIGNGTGSVGSGQPGREGLPGSTPGGGSGSGGSGGGASGTCGNGSCGSGESCVTCPADCGACGGPGGGGIPTPKCGRTHYSCDNGTSSDNQQTNDRWTWLCKIDSHQQYCFERFEGCGDGVVSGITQYGTPEECDEGGSNGFCNSGDGSITCDVNYCRPCSGGTSPPATLPGCGPSNGSSGAPVDPLCVGGAIASPVTTSAVGSSNRYDWTCSVSGMSGAYQCSSGATSVGGGATATCGSAAGVPSSTAPTSGLCQTGNLTVYGVTELVDAQTGQPLWYWSCQIGTGVATSCYAPRTGGGVGSGGSGSCPASTYTWSVGGNSCSASYAGLASNQITRVTDNEGSTWGSAGIQCLGGSPIPNSAFGDPTCSQTTSGASCGTLAAVRGNGGGIAPIASSYCTEGWSDAISCTTASNSISCTWLCRAQSGTASTPCSGTALVD